MTAVYKEVKILQEDLKDNDAYNGPITGRFDLATFNGIKALINSGKLGDPVEVPDPSEDTYGSVIAAFADELNYMPAAVNAVRTAYSEWAREAQNMYTTPAVLSDFSGEVEVQADVTRSVRVLQGVLTRGGWIKDRPREGLYQGPLDGNYTVALENAFRTWISIGDVNMLELLGGNIEFPRLGLTRPVLRAINTARNAAGFGAVQIQTGTRDVKKTVTKDVKKTITKRCPPRAVPYDQKGRCPQGYAAIKDGSGCCAPLTGTKTDLAKDQAKKIADAARLAEQNARNAAKRAEEARRKAAADTKDQEKRAAAERATKEAEAKALAAQATIDAANAAAEAARLRAAEEAAAAQAAQDTTNQAAAEQAAALEAAAAQAAQEAAARVAAAQEALQYAQEQTMVPPEEMPSKEAPSKDLPPAKQLIEPKAAEAPGTPWTKYLLIAGAVAAAVGGWWWYSKNKRITAETADFDEGEELPCSCSKARHG